MVWRYYVWIKIHKEEFSKFEEYKQIFENKIKGHFKNIWVPRSKTLNLLRLCEFDLWIKIII